MTKITEKDLIKIAEDNLNNSYSPYSKLKVSAALLTKSGKVYKGVNVENVSYGATNCAERTAVFTAVTAGETEFEAIAVTSNLGRIITPCGICRQVLSEFGIDMNVYMASGEEYTSCKLSELLPMDFGKDNLLK